MKLGGVLFKEKCSAFQVLTEVDDSQDFNDWELLPLDGPTLAQQDVQGPFQGVFIVAARLIKANAPTISCYLDVVLPERIIDHHYLQSSNGVIRGSGRRVENGTVIPLIGIESPGSYKIFHSKEDPQAGIKVLSDALPKSRRKRDIAYDLGLLLRDQKRYDDAIVAFTAFLSENPSEGIADMVYKERARMYRALGKIDKAEEDLRNFAALFEKKYGHAPSPSER